MKNNDPKGKDLPQPVNGSRWQHYRGGVYIVDGKCILEKTWEMAVLYKPYGSLSTPIARSLKDWYATVPGVGPRFKEIYRPPGTNPANPSEL
jgi:hypothetical protein